MENIKYEKFLDVNKVISDLYHKILLDDNNKYSLNYLLKRKINIELINEYNLGFAPFLFNSKLENNLDIINYSIVDLLTNNLIYIDSNLEYKDFFRNRIIIPIKDNSGNLVGFSGRTISKDDDIKYLNSKASDYFNKSKILFNFYNFDKTKFKEIYIVEGYMDVLSLKTLGINNVVGLMGTFLSKENLVELKIYKNITTINLCLDNDEAGKNSTIELTRHLIKNNYDVNIIKPFNNEIKDCNDLICNYSSEDSLNLLNKKIKYIDYLLINKNLNEMSSKEKINLRNELIKEIASFPKEYKDVRSDCEKIAIFFENGNDFSRELEKIVSEKTKEINIENKKYKETKMIKYNYSTKSNIENKKENKQFLNAYLKISKSQVVGEDRNRILINGILPDNQAFYFYKDHVFSNRFYNETILTLSLDLNESAKIEVIDFKDKNIKNKMERIDLVNFYKDWLKNICEMDLISNKQINDDDIKYDFAIIKSEKNKSDSQIGIFFENFNNNITKDLIEKNNIEKINSKQQAKKLENIQK